jgi:hypothetical protein
MICSATAVFWTSGGGQVKFAMSPSMRAVTAPVAWPASVSALTVPLKRCASALASGKFTPKTKMLGMLCLEQVGGDLSGLLVRQADAEASLCGLIDDALQRAGAGDEAVELIDDEVKMPLGALCARAAKRGVCCLRDQESSDDFCCLDTCGWRNDEDLSVVHGLGNIDVVGSLCERAVRFVIGELSVSLDEGARS